MLEYFASPHSLYVAVCSSYGACLVMDKFPRSRVSKSRSVYHLPKTFHELLHLSSPLATGTSAAYAWLLSCAAPGDHRRLRIDICGLSFGILYAWTQCDFGLGVAGALSSIGSLILDSLSSSGFGFASLWVIAVSWG